MAFSPFPSPSKKLLTGLPPLVARSPHELAGYGGINELELKNLGWHFSESEERRSLDGLLAILLSLCHCQAFVSFTIRYWSLVQDNWRARNRARFGMPCPVGKSSDHDWL